MEILVENQKTFTLKQLLEMSRIWRLDTGESPLEVEKDYNYTRTLPLKVKGRILEPHEIIDEINVADDDILLYEVQAVK